MSEVAQTPDLILDAAEALFARQGFAATSIKQIGAEAGANPALIYYYFQSKEGLYRGVLERMFGTIAANAAALLAEAPGPEAAVQGLVTMQTSVMTARPTFPRMFGRELVDHELEHAGGLVSDLSARFFGRLCDMIRAGQQAGVFRAELDPHFAAISVVSLIPFFHIAQPAVSIFLDRPGGLSDEDKRAYGRHAAAFALAALRAHPHTGDARASADAQRSADPDSSAGSASTESKSTDTEPGAGR
jgi:TetR/AcrR family transcriptional regulator